MIIYYHGYLQTNAANALGQVSIVPKSPNVKLKSESYPNLKLRLLIVSFLEMINVPSLIIEEDAICKLPNGLVLPIPIFKLA